MPLVPEALDAIAEWQRVAAFRPQTTDPVFTQVHHRIRGDVWRTKRQSDWSIGVEPLSSTSILTIVSDRAELAGLAKRVTPQTLRRTFAHKLMEQGIPFESIAKILGHAKLSTTLDYLRRDDVTSSEAHAMLSADIPQPFKGISQVSGKGGEPKDGQGKGRIRTVKETRVEPKVFIGSSREGMPVAEELQVLLDHVAAVTIWTQGIYELGDGTLEGLARTLNSFDFGIFVFSADDILQHRGKRYLSARDNVLIEFGMFLGRLGKERAFVVMPRDVKNFHRPSDIDGIEVGTYVSGRENLEASLGAVSTKIKKAIARLGPVSRNTTSSA